MNTHMETRNKKKRVEASQTIEMCAYVGEKNFIFAVFSAFTIFIFRSRLQCHRDENGFMAHPKKKRKRYISLAKGIYIAFWSGEFAV